MEEIRMARMSKEEQARREGMAYAHVLQEKRDWMPWKQT